MLTSEKLHHGHTGGRFHATAFFFQQAGGSVVRAYHVDTPVGQCLSQSCPVGAALDGRITFDTCSEAGIVGIRVKQMGDTGFGCDRFHAFRGFIPQRIPAEKREFTCGADMGHMESRTGFPGASLTASSVERKQASSLRMAGWYFTSGSSPYRSRNDFRLADMMDESSQWVMMSRGERLNMARSASSRSTSILPVLLPMNSLTPHTLCGSRLFQHVSVRMGGPEEERIVDEALFRCQPELVVQGFESGGLRHDVRHVHVRRHASGRRRPAFGGDVGLVGQSRFAEMHMVVYHARYQVQPFGIYHAVGRRKGVVWYRRTGRYSESCRLPV